MAKPGVIDGQRFDPHEHFQAWRDRQQTWSGGKALRMAKVHTRAGELQLRGESFAAIAGILNAENLRSATGRPWTAETARKLLAAKKEPPRCDTACRRTA